MKQDHSFIYKYYIATVFLLFVAAIGVKAQYNPEDPPEPNLKFQLTVKVQPQEASYSTSGSGTYIPGTQVNVRSSARQNWVFRYWMANGTQIEGQEAQQFTYTMPMESVELVAVYEYVEPEKPPYNPQDPSEPVTIPDKYSLNIVAVPALAASSTSGSGSYTAGSTVWVGARANTNYSFEGWYDKDGQKLSSNSSYGYTMPDEATTLTARFVYTPGSPGDPMGGGQDDVQNHVLRGDVNQDGVVDIADAVMLVNYVVGKYTGPALSMDASDANRDGQIDIADAVRIVNLVVGKINALSRPAMRPEQDEKEPQ